ncbi:hypothetical protein M0813_06831 [Anaeramoeba flamelloides]|uniref:Uncharacterized protein n=1 Tax=Anaeramoeba flamelloides TaxID=1746091 RepID=A0ABQ8XEX2_9EUKA|nr:hypothetical protein M0813_06831 [Anaeramoeba flamelloides]
MGFSLWIEIGSTFSTTRSECGKSIFEDLFVPKEFDNGKVNSWKKPEASFVWPNGRVGLYMKTSVNVLYFIVVNPSHVELKNFYWSNDPFHYL